MRAVQLPQRALVCERTCTASTRTRPLDLRHSSRLPRVDVLQDGPHARVVMHGRRWWRDRLLLRVLTRQVLQELLDYVAAHHAASL
jgi:hypothetical protein